MRPFVDAYFGLIVWTALANEGLGANLQHYNPHIDDAIAKEWDIPNNWNLKAQLVFGEPTGDPKEKAMIPVEERMKIFGAQDQKLQSSR